jgi:hypothetical protein
VVAAGVVTAVADAATKADQPETKHVAGPESIVKAPSGPLLCPMTAVASAHCSGCPAAQRSSANRALPTVVEALSCPRPLATRSRACGSGPRKDVGLRDGRACVRVRKGAMAVGVGESLGSRGWIEG